MNRRLLIVTCALTLVVGCMAGSAGADESYKNIVTAYASQGETENAVVLDIWLENVNPVVGVTLPLKFGLSQDSLFLDSLSVASGTAKGWVVAKPVYDAAKKTLLLNALRGVDPKNFAPAIPPGRGPYMRVYMSARGGIALDEFQAVSVTLPPNNDILYVTASMNSVNPAFEFKRGGPSGEDQNKGGKKEKDTGSK